MPLLEPGCLIPPFAFGTNLDLDPFPNTVTNVRQLLSVWQYMEKRSMEFEIINGNDSLIIQDGDNHMEILHFGLRQQPAGWTRMTVRGDGIITSLQTD